MKDHVKSLESHEYVSQTLIFENVYNFIENLDNIGDIDEIKSGYQAQTFHNLLQRGTMRPQDV